MNLSVSHFLLILQYSHVCLTRRHNDPVIEIYIEAVIYCTVCICEAMKGLAVEAVIYLKQQRSNTWGSVLPEAMKVQHLRLFSTWSHEGPALEAVLYLKPWRSRTWGCSLPWSHEGSRTWGCSLPEAMKVQDLRLFSTWKPWRFQHLRLFSTWSHEVHYSRLFSTWSHEGPGLEAEPFSCWGCPPADTWEYLLLPFSPCF